MSRRNGDGGTAEFEDSVEVSAFRCVFDDGLIDDHSAESSLAGSLAGMNAEGWEVVAEERRESVADFPAERGGHGFGGFEGHPVACEVREKTEGTGERGIP